MSLYELAAHLVVAVIFVFWLYRDARGRDYNWMVWVLTPVVIAILPTTIWLLIVVLMPFIYLALRPRGQMDPCPHCKKKVLDELAFCPYCRRSVKRECLKCHRTVPWDAIICPHCKSSNLTDS